MRGRGRISSRKGKALRIRDYSERLKIPVQISVGYQKYPGGMNEWLVQKIKQEMPCLQHPTSKAAPDFTQKKILGKFRV